jgi:hypothetical protein
MITPHRLEQHCYGWPALAASWAFLPARRPATQYPLIVSDDGLRRSGLLRQQADHHAQFDALAKQGTG